MDAFILYLLTSMWAVGTMGGFIFLMLEVSDYVLGRAIFAAVVIPIWVLVGLGPTLYLVSQSGPQLAVLMKADWQCNASHRETSTSYVKSGAVMLPLTVDTDVCDVYGRKQ